jgi:hypothetical protein
MTRPDHIVEIKSLEHAAGVLGVPADAGARELRAAYVRQIQAHPPDVDAEAFERVRDAYALLRDPQRRALWWLESADPEAPLISLLEEPCHVGPGPWLEAIARMVEP